MKLRRQDLLGAHPGCEYCAGRGWVHVEDNPFHSVCPECYPECAGEPLNYESLSALGTPYPNGTVLWWRGDPEDHLYGFATKECRDRYAAGEPGCFERVLRPLDAPPISDEVRLARALCDGSVEDTIDHLDAMARGYTRPDTKH